MLVDDFGLPVVLRVVVSPTGQVKSVSDLLDGMLGVLHRSVEVYHETRSLLPGECSLLDSVPPTTDVTPPSKLRT